MQNDLEEFRRNWVAEISAPSKSPSQNGIANNRQNNAREHSIKLGEQIIPLDNGTEFLANKRKIHNNLEEITKPAKLKILSNLSLVEILINDLNEINDVPFFDISIPREVALKIFQHLDLKDLCSCAQVSRSWKSLAEDDLLWKKFGVKLGILPPVPSVEIALKGWKWFVLGTLRNEQTLQQNWKNRSGKLYELEDPYAGIITSVHSHHGAIIAGYSHGTVNLWDMDEGSGVQQELYHQDGDHVTQVAISENFLAASFASGKVYLSSRITLKEHIIEAASLVTDLMASEEAAFSCWDTTLYKWGTDGDSRITLPYKINQLTEIPKEKKSCWPLKLLVTDESTIRIVDFSGFPKSQVLHLLLDDTVNCVDANSSIMALGLTSPSYHHLFKASIMTLDTGQFLGELTGHTLGIHFIDLCHTPPNWVLTGCRDKRVRVFDLRCGYNQASLSFQAHSMGVTCGQMASDHLLSTGGEDGLICVWDVRHLNTKLWEMNSWHPVRYLRAHITSLVTANIPNTAFTPPGEYVVHKRHRGSLHVYDFSAQQESKSIPSICLSSYDEPAGYNYNIRLTVPYDTIN